MPPFLQDTNEIFTLPKCHNDSKWSGSVPCDKGSWSDTEIRSTTWGPKNSWNCCHYKSFSNTFLTPFRVRSFRCDTLVPTLLPFLETFSCQYVQHFIHECFCCIWFMCTKVLEIAFGFDLDVRNLTTRVKGAHDLNSLCLTIFVTGCWRHNNRFEVWFLPYIQ